jgi:hypothetical protein
LGGTSGRDRRDPRQRGYVLWIHTGGLTIRVAWDHGDGRPEFEDLDVSEGHYGLVVPLDVVAQLGLE